ncbi:MAG: ABC transporter substrate-binding protein [Sphaerochaetaceae bacterium]|nr:ABC transporter substrate-binding protein [Sphaerochaetaceae bacterium]NLO61570.1 ABC transporter substrate-binding protein [Spirochaetales bacterium]MDD2405939.1 ABC transporter substrate-binding protein [Sphaerochaetaceae bacterium]MDD3670343.1 ABC transporter substrate-binding protein [Sphaerochaetaceae bacterium]MDD4260321.1 ABC transporter substrate-binding protein [Sphaerochaetaceae bacterium]
MKKLVLCMAVLLVAGSLLYATGAAEQTPKTTPRPAVVKLQVWYAMSGASGEMFVKQAKEFDDARADIELELTYSGSYADTATKVSAALLSGNAPDVAVMAAGQLYSGERGDFSMEQLIEDPEFNKNDIFEGMWEYAKYEGRIASVPYGISTQVLYYNKKIIDKAGIDLSNPPKTWHEFLAIAKQAQQRGNATNSSDFWGFDTSDGVWLIKSMLYQNGNKVVDKQGENIVPVFQDAKGIEVATFWKRLVDEGVMPSAQHNNAEKKFLAGNLAFIAASSNRISRWTTSDTVELGAIPMPSFTQRSLALGGNGIVILTQNEHNRQAGWELIKHLTKTENQTAFALGTGYLPIRKSALDSQIVKDSLATNPNYKVAFDQLATTWAYMHFGEMGSMDANFWYALDEIEKNVLTPAEAMDKAAKALLKEME